MGVPPQIESLPQAEQLSNCQQRNAIASIAHRHRILCFPSQKGANEGVPVHWSFCLYRLIQSGLYKTKQPTFGSLIPV